MPPTLIPTEPIGSIPRPLPLIEAVRRHEAGEIGEAELDRRYDDAIERTIREFEATGSPVITDGEQRKYHNFANYCVHGLPNYTFEGGFRLQFVDHYRQWPVLSRGPFRYLNRGDDYLKVALGKTRLPVKQAVISPSALSLVYPHEELPDYSREQFIDDLIGEHVGEIRSCLELGAHCVQIDFTEGRFAHKVDRSGGLLRQFIDLNNMALARFSADERARIGIHTCPGGDRDSTHSRDVDYAELLPGLFELQATNFYIALAGEPDQARVLEMIRRHLGPGQRAFLGVIDPLDPRIETAAEVRDRVLAAARVLPPEQLGTTDDCGFAPFSDDTSTTRETAFAKIRARVEGTAMAREVLFP